MKEIDYIFFLTSEMTDRLRVQANKEKGVIIEFVVQYEALISGQWYPVIRYDTAHGFAHKDIMTKKGRIVKQPLHFETYNLAFTYASMDLKTNWQRYRSDFEKET